MLKHDQLGLKSYRLLDLGTELVSLSRALYKTDDTI